MNANHTAQVCALLLALPLATSCDRKERGDNTPSYKTLDGLLSYKGVHRLLVGPQAVTTQGDNFENKEISRDEFTEVLAWAKAGLIELKSEDVLSDQKEFSWQDWIERTQSGHIKRITVTLTEPGVRLDKAAPVEKRDPNFTYALFYATVLEKVVSTELKPQGANHYCIVQALVTQKMTEEGEKVFKLWGRPMPKRYKLIALLKYDPFERKWLLVASDTAPDGEPIQSERVNEALLRGL